MTARLLRTVAAVFLVSGGVVHYHLWTSGYRHVPRIGTLFLANFVGSIVLGAAVLVSRRVSVELAAAVFAVGSLAALVLSRTVGVLGFSETIWTPDAVKTLASEIGVILTLGAAMAMQWRAAHHHQLAPVER